MRFNLATIQLSLTDNVELNYEKLARILDELEKGSLVLLPEMFFCGFDYARMEEFALLSSYIVEKLRLASKEKELMICGTVPEKSEEGIKNTAILIDRGEVLGKRSKIKLFPPFEEDKHFVPGRENTVFDTRFGRVGILICFELRFTDMVLELKRKNIDILLVPAQWGYARKEHLRILSQARAIELQSYVVVSNTWGEFKGVKFAGQSGIYSPWGEVLEFSETGDIYLEAEADLSYLSKVRETIPINIE
jgi:predicted amidohydrolase